MAKPALVALTMMAPQQQPSGSFEKTGLLLTPVLGYTQRTQRGQGVTQRERRGGKKRWEGEKGGRGPT